MKILKTKHFRLLAIMTVAILVLTTASAQLNAGEKKGDYFANDYKPTLQQAKEYTLEMANLMPDEHFNFKPTPEIMSYSGQLAHIAGVIYFMASKVKGEDNPGKGFKAEGKSKADVIKYAGEAFDYALKVLAGLTDKEAHVKIKLWEGMELDKYKVFFLMRDHTTHHRGAMVIYLRLKGIKPAQYRG